MAIGRITGQMLFPNLERQGVNLQVDTDLAYFDVTSRRLGIATQSPTQTLDVNGNAHIANLSILGNTITSDTGKIGLGTTANIVITGGTSYDVLYTDGNGNLAFGNLNSLATQDFFTGNNIALGTNTAGQLVSNAITFLTTTSVTDAIARINNLLGNISNPTGSTLTTGNLSITSGVTSNNYQTGAITVEGGVGINGNLYVSGNINTTAGNITILNSAFFVGNAETGFGAIYAGIPTGYHVLPQLVAQFSANYNGYAQINNQNINSGQFASSDFVATADNGTDSINFIDLGIASSTYNYPAFSAIRPNDSYLYGNGGNLNLITDTVGKNINFVVGGGNLEHIAVQIHHSNTISTSSNTGTLVVVGDAGISGNVKVGANFYSDSASFGSINDTPIGNTTPSTGTFTYLKATVGFSTANAVISGGELTNLGNVNSTNGNFTTVTSSNVVVNANLTVNGALTIPAGVTIDRPAGPAGQIRFNTEYGTIEYYNGIDWALITNTLEDQIIDYADGVQTTFTLVQPSTATALLVSINGTMQQPGGSSPAYTVAGDQLTFAQAPLPTDFIDIRFIASATTPDLSVFSGNIGTRETYQTVNFGQGVIYAYNYCPTLLDSTTILNVGTGATVIDSFSANEYRTGKYVISSSYILGFEYQSDEILVVHNGVSANLNVLGTTYTGANSIMNFSANIVSGNVVIYGAGVSSGNNVKLTKTLISI